VEQLVRDVEHVSRLVCGRRLQDIAVCRVIAELSDDVSRTHQVAPDQVPLG
jgi:hypothetical protein